MRGKRGPGRFAEADVGDVEELKDCKETKDDSRTRESLHPIGRAAKGSQKTAARSVIALIALILVALYLVVTENTSIEHKATKLGSNAEKRVLSELQGNPLVDLSFEKPVVENVSQSPPVVAVHHEVQQFQVQQVQRVPEVAENDGPLPELSASLVERHSNTVPGQLRKLVIAVIVDWQPQGNALQVQQTKMTVSWVRTMKRLGAKCVVGICENRMDVTRNHLRDIFSEDWCGVFKGTIGECLEGPRLGRWWYVKHFLDMGYDVMSSDPDISFFRDPSKYFGKLIAQHPNADVFTTTDTNNGIVLKGKGPEGFSGMVESPDPPAPGAQPSPELTIWQKSFPHIKRKEGFVFKSEFAGRDASLGVGQLVELLATQKYELGLEDPLNCEHQFNTGLMYWRATPAALKLIVMWQEYLKTTCCDWRTKDDQLPANIVFKNHSTHCPMWNGQRGSGMYFAAQEKYRSVCGEDPMLNIVADGSGCLGILNVVQFANGFVFSTQRSHEQHNVRPYTFHATYSNDKLMSLRQEGVFMDNPEYYNVAGGLLVYDPVIRTDMMHSPIDTDAVEGFYTPQAHVIFVQHQLQQLRSALAIAKTLGRTLVLPRMACICQCFFFPGKNCNIDGHRVRLPHICPTDHWLRPGRLKLPYREPGFLENPRLPSGVSTKQAVVKVCADGSCAVSADPSSGNVLLKPNMTDKQLSEALKPVSNFPVLHLTDIWNSWGGFEDQPAAASFLSEIGNILSSWCCLKTHPDGVRPEVEVWKIPYHWDGPMEPVPDTEDVGKCGA